MFTMWNHFSWWQTWKQPPLLKTMSLKCHTGTAGLGGHCSGLHKTTVTLRRVGLSWLWVRSLKFCAVHQCLSKAMHIFPGKGSPPSSCSSHAYPGILRFSTNTSKRNKSHLDQWSSTRDNFATLSFLGYLDIFCTLLSLHMEFSPLWNCRLPQLLCFSA